MKQYKVGDTIYVKGKVKQLDKDGNIYCYQVDIADVGPLWVYNSDMVEKLPVTEPVKPVLPKGVAEELEGAKKNNYTFVGYMNKAIVNDYDETNGFVYLANVSSDDMIKVLSDAWYNGYTVKQEPRYKVYVTGTNKQYMYVKRGELAKAHNKKATPITPQSIGNYITAGGNRDLYWFTDEEINRFNLQDCEKELVADDNED